MHGTALLAAPYFFIAVESFEDWGKVLDDALQPQLRAMHEVVTVRAIPLEGIELTFRPRHLDHHSDRVSGTLGRVAHVLRKQEHLSFADRDLYRWLAGFFDYAQLDVALELIKEFFGRVVVKVASLVRTTDHGDHELAVFPHLGIADGWLELVAVLFDPALQVECFQRRYRRHLSSLTLGRAACRPSP